MRAYPTTDTSTHRPTLLGALLIALTPMATANAASVKLTPVSTVFNNPIGIDYHQPTNSVVISVNYSSGQPFNFERIDQFANHIPFSNVSGFTDEVKIATVRSGNAGGFTTGDLFTGNGNDGEIARITNNGATVISPWVSLPGAGNGLMRGSMFVDRGGAFGGDLIAVTTVGEVWRVTSAGVPTFLTNIGTHLEGMMTLPNNPAYGPLAGKIIAGAENQSLLYAIDPSGAVSSYNLGLPIEDIDLIDANENFFGVNFGTGRILRADASYFSGIVGDILLTSEFGVGGSALTRLYWNGSSLVTEPIGLTGDSFIPGQWEHVTFAPTEIPEPAALTMLALGGLGLVRRGRR